MSTPTPAPIGGHSGQALNGPDNPYFWSDKQPVQNSDLREYAGASSVNTAGTANYWSTVLVPQPEPQQQIEEVATVSRATSDFIGVAGWRREDAVRTITREPTALETYAQEREQLGIRNAPESTVGDPRVHASAWRPTASRPDASHPAWRH